MEQIAENLIADVIQMHAIGEQGSVHTAVRVAKGWAEICETTFDLRFHKGLF